MSYTAVAVFTAAVFAWGALSARLTRADLTAPIVFVALGGLLSESVSLDADVGAEAVQLVTEVTLVWVLFSDAARVGLRELRADTRVLVSLLGVALPVTVALGWVLAESLFDGFDVWLALLVGAALAPTDAALGSAVITNVAVPTRVRRILNVESGLNDGIATPIVLVALAGAVSAEGLEQPGPGGAVLGLLSGVVVGVAVGVLGGTVLRAARRRGWTDEHFAGPAVLALAVLAYAVALAVDGNGFVAAFTAGVAFGHTAGRAGPHDVHYVEQTAGLASLLVWTLFGALALPIVVDAFGWQVLLYAVSSLTVIRMLPVSLVLLGTDLPRGAGLFIGWFGPRGLASVVFALLAVQELGPAADPAVAVITTTVLFSVVAHGMTAGPLSVRFGARVGTEPATPEPVPTARYGSRARTKQGATAERRSHRRWRGMCE